MNRLGLIHPSTLTGRHNSETAAVYQAFSEYTLRHHRGQDVTYSYQSTGALVGQFGILLHTPPVARAYLDLSSSLREVPGLSQRANVIIALVVGANENASFMRYANGRIAECEGFSQAEIQAMLAGLYPSSFTTEEKATYVVTRELCVSSGPLPERMWNEAVEVLGRQGAIAVVHHVAFQRYVATLLRGFDAQTPPPGEMVENQG